MALSLTVILFLDASIFLNWLWLQALWPYGGSWLGSLLFTEAKHKIGIINVCQISAEWIHSRNGSSLPLQEISEKSPTGQLKDCHCHPFAQEKSGWMDGYKPVDSQRRSLACPCRLCLQLKPALCSSHISLLPWTKSTDRMNSNIWELWGKERITSAGFLADLRLCYHKGVIISFV